MGPTNLPTLNLLSFFTQHAQGAIETGSFPLDRVRPTITRCGDVVIVPLAETREDGAELIFPYVGILGHGKIPLVPARNLRGLKFRDKGRDAITMLSERTGPTRYVTKQTRRSRWLPFFFDPQTTVIHTEPARLGPFIPVALENIQNQLVMSGAVLTGIAPSLLEPDMRTHYEFLAVLSYLQENFVINTDIPEYLDPHMTPRTREKLIDDILNNMTDGRGNEADGGMEAELGLHVFDMTSLKIGSQWISKIVERIARTKNSSLLAACEYSSWYEGHWAPRVALSLIGGQEGIQAVFDGFRPLLKNYREFPGNNIGTHWSIAFEEVLTEALLLATTTSDADVALKRKLLEQVLATPELTHAHALIRKSLTNTEHMNVPLTAKQHRADAHQIFLNYFAARSQQEDYTFATQHGFSVGV
jgi:hypothetical protein